MQPKRSRCVTRLRVNALFLLGLGLVLLAAVLPVIWPLVFQNIINSQLKMTPDSKTYEVWTNNPVPIYIDFYFFNWTNQASLREDGDMHIPQFQEVGPYRFKERIDRVNVTWNSNNTVTYKQAKWWFFDAENSKGSLDDNITTLNIVALTAAFTGRDWSYLMQASITSAFSMTDQHLHVVRSVRELLFDGYSDKLINMAMAMPAFAGVKVPFDKFGWFYKRNGTSFMDGVFNMNTGAEDMQQIGKLENWNYKNSTNFYSGECADVRGTTGQLFSPGKTRSSKIQMFSPDLCRSISFEYGEDTIVNGVHGYKYVGGLSMLDNGTLFPDNECYCNGECVPSGVVNVTSCRFGAPAFASFPHFYLADPFFTDNVRGLRPIKEKHQFYLTLEPNTGIPLDVAARFQINLLLQPISGMRLYENVPTLFFPMIWFQQRATIIPSMAFSLRLLLLVQHLGIVLASATALTGCVIVCYAALLCVRGNRKRTIELEKEKEESYTYVAALDSTQKEKNTNQYIVMTPTKSITESAKL